MVILRAEAGLSECVREIPGCADDMNQFVITMVLVAVAVTVWAAVVLYSSAEISTARLGVGRAALWLLAVWALPLAGFIAWRFYARSRRCR